VIKINLMSWQFLLVFSFIITTFIAVFYYCEARDYRDELHCWQRTVDFIADNEDRIKRQQEVINNANLQLRGFRSYQQLEIVNKILSLDPRQLAILSSNLLPFDPANAPGQD